MSVPELAAALAIDTKLTSFFANGAFHKAGGTLSLTSPLTGEPLCEGGDCQADDVATAVAAAQAAFPAWSKTTGAERAAWLRKLAAATEAKKEPLMQLEAVNVGRTINEMAGDLEDTGAFLEYYAGMAEKLDAKQNSKVDAPAGYEITMRYDAAGVAACILPFNWPLVNVILKLAPALAAGCCIVLKPSEFTPLTALAFAQIAAEIDFPAGVINLVTGVGSNCGAALTAHPDVNVVGFTGSVRTGCQIARDAQTDDAAKHVFAEMGGKSAAIVLEDVDGARMDDVIDWIMFGIFIGNGQACSATSRLLLHRAIAPTLLPRLVAAVKGIQVGNHMDPDSRLGPLITKAQQQKVLGFIQRALDAGAESLTGDGTATPAEYAGGNFVSPVVFNDVDTALEVWQEEVFGPVLCVRVFDTDEEAVALANDSQYGLAGAVITNDQTRATQICESLRVGCAWINCIQPMFPNTVWGGPGRSSIGRELGEYSLNNFLEPKQICNFVGHREEPLGHFPSASSGSKV